MYGALAYNGEKINEAKGRLLTTNRIYNDGKMCIRDRFRCLHELSGSFLIDFFRDDVPPAHRAEIALHPVPFLRRLGQEKVAGVFQVRAFVEVTLERAA